LSNVHRILCWNLLTSISQVLKNELSDILSSKRDMPYAAANNETI
jgi:hypothetical protein